MRFQDSAFLLSEQGLATIYVKIAVELMASRTPQIYCNCSLAISKCMIQEEIYEIAASFQSKFI